MKTTHSTAWHTRLVTFFLAAAAAASAGFWTLQWPSRADVQRISVPVNAPDAIDSSNVAQVLGHSIATTAGAVADGVAATPGFKLLGVITTGPQRGSALIAIDTLPAKPYRVGDRVSDNLVLRSVSARSVVLGDGDDAGDGITLTLPLPPRLP